MYESMWKELEKRMTRKAMTPTFNSKTELKQAQEIARKQTYFEVIDIMKDINKKYSKHSEDKFSLGGV